VSQFLITVTVQTRHGRTNLHTFGIQSEAEHLGWFIETPASSKQLKERTVPGVPFLVGAPTGQRRRIGARYYMPIGTRSYGPIDDGPIHLGPGVDIGRRALNVILDALRSDQRPTVDLADIKAVVSQLGSHMSRLDNLDEDQRGHAESALYMLILKRCIRSRSATTRR